MSDNDNKDLVEQEQSPARETIIHKQGGTPWGVVAFVFVAVLLALAAGAFSFYLFQLLQQNKMQLDDIKVQVGGVGGKLSGRLDSVGGRFAQVNDRFKQMIDSNSQRFQSVSDQLSDVHQKINAIKRDLGSAVAAREKLQEQTRAEIQKLARNQTQLSKKQVISNQQLSQAIDRLYRQKGKTRNDWILSEVEYLLLIANHGLTLSGDVNTAIRALESADTRLLDMGDPSIISIRSAIADELAKLQSVPQVDMSGVMLKLGSLIKQIPKLVVLNSEVPGVESLLQTEVKTVVKQEAAPATGNSDQTALSEHSMAQYREQAMQALNKFLNELKNLVVVRKKEARTLALVTPQQEFFTRQMLALKLDMARKALWDGRNQWFHQLIDEAIELLRKHFEPKAASTRFFISQLTAFQKLELAPKLPDISYSHQLLKQYIKKREDQRQQEAQVRKAEPVTNKE